MIDVFHYDGWFSQRIQAYIWGLEVDIANRSCNLIKDEHFNAEIDKCLEDYFMAWQVFEVVDDMMIEKSINVIDPEILKKYHECRKEVDAMINFFNEGDILHPKMADLAMQALEEYKAKE